MLYSSLNTLLGIITCFIDLFSLLNPMLEKKANLFFFFNCRNYVVQYVLELQLQWAINGILEQLEGNYTELSMQKCSSNVVEKCLRLADNKQLTRIIRELVNYGLLDQVMLDPYGNYVIQAALKRSKVKHTNHKTVD